MCGPIELGLIEAQLYRPKSSDILNADLDQNYLEKWKGYIFLFCCDIGGYPQVVSLGCKFAVSKGHVGRISPIMCLMSDNGCFGYPHGMSLSTAGIDWRLNYQVLIYRPNRKQPR